MAGFLSKAIRGAAEGAKPVLQAQMQASIQAKRDAKLAEYASAAQQAGFDQQNQYLKTTIKANKEAALQRDEFEASESARERESRAAESEANRLFQRGENELNRLLQERGITLAETRADKELQLLDWEIENAQFTQQEKSELWTLRHNFINANTPELRREYQENIMAYLGQRPDSPYAVITQQGYNQGLPYTHQKHI